MRYALAIAAMSGALSIIPAGVSAAAAPAPSFLDDGTPSAAKHATRGTVKSINATTLVITRPGKSDMTFELDPSLHREGTIDVGTMVSVRYHEEGARHIATAIAVDNHSRAEQLP